MNIFCVGVSHRTAPVELRERLALPPSAIKAALSRLDCGHYVGCSDLREMVILSTCNRLELYAASHGSDFEPLIHLLSEITNVAREQFGAHLYLGLNRVAVAHLFEVAAGLDSLVLGEPQILGQVVDAYELARGQGATGAILSTLFRTAIHAGKRARSETSIGRNPASVSSVAVRCAAGAVDDLAAAHITILGAGEMAELAADALRARGAGPVTVINRTLAHAEAVAARWGGCALTFERMGTALAEADIVLVSTSAPHILVSVEAAQEAMAARPALPLVFIDISVPRNVDPAVAELPNVRYYDIDHLEAAVTESLAGRDRERPRVQAILGEEVEAFMHWHERLEIAPLIADLRARAETIRRAEVDKALRRLPNLDEAERRRIEAFSTALVNKLLHAPTERLKAVAGNGHSADYATTVRDLFSLNS